MKKQIYSGTDSFYSAQTFAEFMEGMKFEEVSPSMSETGSARNVFYSNYFNVTVVNDWDNSYSIVTGLGRAKPLGEVEKMILKAAEKSKESKLDKELGNEFPVII